MWESLAGLITLIIMVIKLFLDYRYEKEAQLNADKKEIKEAIASGDLGRINAVVERMRL